MTISRGKCGMKYYGLYKITNLVNGKMYIGQHTTEDLNDGYMGSGIVIKQAIKKYGVGNFRKEWIGFYEDAEELDYMERVFVDETWVSSSDTYNLCIGGGYSQLTEESKRKLAKSVSIAMKGRVFTDEWKKKISQKKMASNWMRGRTGCKHPQFGKPKSQVTRDKIGKANSKTVFQYTKDMEFAGKYTSQMEAERKTGVYASHISSCCTGKRKTAGGFIWKFVEENK